MLLLVTVVGGKVGNILEPHGPSILVMTIHFVEVGLDGGNVKFEIEHDKTRILFYLFHSVDGLGACAAVDFGGFSEA